MLAFVLFMGGSLFALAFVGGLCRAAAEGDRLMRQHSVWRCPVCDATELPSRMLDSVPYEGNAHCYTGTLVCDKPACGAEALLRQAAWVSTKKLLCPPDCFYCRMERWERGEEAVPDDIKFLRCQPDELDDDHRTGWAK